MRARFIPRRCGHPRGTSQLKMGQGVSERTPLLSLCHLVGYRAKGQIAEVKKRHVQGRLFALAVFRMAEVGEVRGQVRSFLQVVKMCAQVLQAFQIGSVSGLKGL